MQRDRCQPFICKHPLPLSHLSACLYGCLYHFLSSYSDHGPPPIPHAHPGTQILSVNDCQFKKLIKETGLPINKGTWKTLHTLIKVPFCCMKFWPSPGEVLRRQLLVSSSTVSPELPMANLPLTAADIFRTLLPRGLPSSALPLDPSCQQTTSSPRSVCPMVTESLLRRSRHPLSEALHVTTNPQPLLGPSLFENSAALLSSSSVLILS